MKGSRDLSNNDVVRMKSLNKDLVNGLFRQKSTQPAHNKTQELVDLIQRVVDERIELYLNRFETAIETNEPKELINEIEAKEKEVWPRQIQFGFIDSTDFDNVDSYYAEKARENLENLSLTNQLATDETRRGVDEQHNQKIDPRRQMKRLRKVEDRERKWHTKEEKKTR